MSRRVTWSPVVVVLLLAGCMSGEDVQNVQGILSGGPRPDVMPQLRNAEPPFRYPASLYARRVQGDVTLRIFIDSAGRVHPESTRVVQTSGYGTLDTAAINGSRELSFQPAMRKERPMAVWVLYPIQFRHPDAPPLPGDSARARDTAGPASR